MEKFLCTVCGGELKRGEGNLFQCKHCGAKFRDGNRADSAIEYFNREKQEQRARACMNLYSAVNDAEEYDTDSILSYARELKRLCPDHFLANFYEVACGDDEREIKRFLEGIDAQKDGIYLRQVIGFMLRIAELKHISSLKALLERAKNQGVLESGEYNDCMTKIEKLERDLDSGKFDPSSRRDVFIAYSSKDMDEVNRVVEFLEEEGEITCWTAARNLRHGKGGLQNYWEGITTAISNCSGIVFISTKNSRTLECEAVHKEKNRWGMVGELPYIEKNHPEMFRLQYFPPSDKGGCTEGARRVLDRFFAGVEDCRDLKTLREWVIEKKLNAETELLSAGKERDEEFKFCKNCGAENKMTVKFCSECGGNEFCDSREEYIRFSTEKRIREEYEKKIRELQEAQASSLKRAEEAAKVPAYPTLENYEREEFEIEGTTLKEYKKKDASGEVRIPEGVTRIGDSAFSDCKNLTSVIIPGSVTAIGDNPFAFCPSLEKIEVESGNPKYISRGNCLINKETKELISGCKNSVIPTDGSVDMIGIWAFRGCNITKIEIPKTVTEIAKGAFCYCQVLTKIVIPKSVISIWVQESDFRFEPNLFSGCTSLREIEVEEGNPVYISRGNCLIEKETKTLIAGCVNSVIPTDGSVVEIGVSAFFGCDELKKIFIPDAVTSIGVFAFGYCRDLTEIAIPKGVTSIEESVFFGCDSLSSVSIPKGVTSIGGFAFKLCTHLTNISIPEGVVSIGEMAFYGCINLKSIVIPKGVAEIGFSAFERCKRLSVFCEAEREPEGWSKAWNSGKRPVEWGYFGPAPEPKEESDGYPTLENYDHEEFEIEGTVLKRYNMIDASGEVLIPRGVTEIGLWCAFFDSKRIMIPKSVTSIEGQPFKAGFQLVKIEVEEGNPRYMSRGNCLIDKETKVLVAGCKESVIPTDGSVTSIGHAAFFLCSNLTSIAIPKNITSIGYSAFNRCFSLTSIVIPKSVTSIGKEAFFGCKNLTIYCEAKSKPEGWSEDWNLDKRPVVWGHRT